MQHPNRWGLAQRGTTTCLIDLGRPHGPALQSGAVEVAVGRWGCVAAPLSCHGPHPLSTAAPVARRHRSFRQ